MVCLKMATSTDCSDIKATDMEENLKICHMYQETFILKV